MLNPSTADASNDDPTVRRCIGYAVEWSYGALVVGNLFALRSTDPERLYEHHDPVGPENDDHLRAMTESAETVIAAWGAHGNIRGRGREVATMLSPDLSALDTTKEGHPNHPLYQPPDAKPEPFEYG
jgi:hypothetical protein